MYRIRDRETLFTGPGTLTAVAGSTLNYRNSRDGAASGTLSVSSFLDVSEGHNVWVWSAGSFTDVTFAAVDRLPLPGGASLYVGVTDPGAFANDGDIWIDTSGT